MKSGLNLIKILLNYKLNSIGNGRHLNKSLKIKVNALKNYNPWSYSQRNKKIKSFKKIPII